MTDHTSPAPTPAEHGHERQDDEHPEHMPDDRAEKAILSAAEAYRLVEEARQMREERDAAIRECHEIRMALGHSRMGLAEARAAAARAERWSSQWKLIAHRYRRMLGIHRARSLDEQRATDDARAERDALLAALQRFATADAALKAFEALDRTPVRERYGLTEASTMDDAIEAAQRVDTERKVLVAEQRESLDALLALAAATATAEREGERTGHRFVPMSGTRDPETNRYARCSVNGCALAPEDHDDRQVEGAARRPAGE